MLKRYTIHIISLAGVVVVGVTAFIINSTISQNVRLDLEKSLATVLYTTHNAIQTWARENRSVALIAAQRADVRRIAGKFLAGSRLREDLVRSPLQEELRNRLRVIYEGRDYPGYFLIGPDNISLSSTRDGNIGTENLLVAQPDFLRRIWAGETALSLPLRSDVPLFDRQGVLLESLPTMFVGAPVTDESGNVIAVLAFRIDPQRDFAPLLELGRIGETGETYAFDRDGLLISPSRFNSHLRQAGLIGPGDGAALNLSVRDPGVNLLEQARPNIAQDKMPLTLMAESAIRNGRGSNLEGYRDYRGVPVIGVWLWDEELHMGLTTELDVSQARSFLSVLTLAILATATAIGLLIVLAAISLIYHKKQIAREARLRQREVRFSAILSTATDAIITIDEMGAIDLFNPAAEEMFGYSVDEVVGRPVDILMRDRYRAAHSVSLARYLRTGKSKIIGTGREVEGLRKDGTTFPVDLALAEWNSDGRKMFTASLRDMTHQRAVEKALLRQNRTVKLMSGIATASSRASTFSGAVTYCLNEICAYLEWPVGHAYLAASNDPDRLVSSRMWHLDDVEQFAAFQTISEAMEYQKGEGLPGRILASHEPLWIPDVNKDDNFLRACQEENLGVRAGVAFPVLVEREVVAVFEFFSVDAVERDQGVLDLLAKVGGQLGRVFEREDAVKELRYRAELLSKIHQAVITESMDGRITSWNDSATRIWGYTEQEAIGQHYSMLFAQGESVAAPENLANLRRGRGIFEEERRFRRKSGEEFIGQYSITFVKDSDENPTSIIAIASDITDRKQAEDRLRQSQQLEVLGRMAGGVAHEFNNLLLPISMLAELSLRKLSSDSKTAKNLKKILMATRRGQTLVGQILDFSRRHVAERQKSDLQSVVQEAVELLETTLPATTRIQYTSGDIPEKALINPTEIHQLLFNLGTNASNAIGQEPGEIVIRLEKCEDCDGFAAATPRLRSGPHARLTVSDDGCGMDEDMLKRAFDPFYTTKSSGEGTGLGLAIVQAIVDGHEGAISVESQVAVGTTFDVRLPLI